MNMENKDNYDNILAMGANAAADIQLGKNLLKHYDDFNGALLSLKAMITNSREAGEEYIGYQKMVLQLILWIAQIRFKLFSEGLGGSIPMNNKGLVTNLELSKKDYQDRVNMPFHITTLNYDIDSVEQTIIEELEVGIPENVVKIKAFKDSLLKLRDLHQEGLNKQNYK